ncbi:hypothetical protein EG329_013979 [Mollisiaceae sp. DMI_Dod_QoI]|nr:hypothetical protein EG329_013979 [Helotiales sp. DMI_Dod_QoI]
MAIGFFKNYRVYILTSVAYMGSLLFGYDTGVMSSVLSLASFKKDFGLPMGSTGFASKTNAHISQNVVGIQLIPGGMLFIGLLFLKESPRWLVKQGRYEEATASLAYMRRDDINDPEVLKEMADIRASIEEELALTEGVTWKECLVPGNRNRFLIAFTMFLCQQFSGTNSIGYYAPQIFQTIGVSKTNASLFATGVYGTVKVCATGLFLIVGIDKIGRRNSLLAGALWMMAMMFILGAVLNTHPPTNVNVVSPASIAMVVMIYLYVIGYSASWGPIPWVYVSEIFPTRLRSYGVGLAAATQWLFNFAITYMTPSAINHIGWRIFLMFGIFCLANFAFVYFFVKETKNRTLEDMDVLFGTVDAEVRAADIERVLQKGIMNDDQEMAGVGTKVPVTETRTVEDRDAAAIDEKTVS